MFAFVLFGFFVVVVVLFVVVAFLCEMWDNKKEKRHAIDSKGASAPFESGNLKKGVY